MSHHFWTAMRHLIKNNNYLKDLNREKKEKYFWCRFIEIGTINFLIFLFSFTSNFDSYAFDMFRITIFRIKNNLNIYIPLPILQENFQFFPQIFCIAVFSWEPYICSQKYIRKVTKFHGEMRSAVCGRLQVSDSDSSTGSGMLCVSLALATTSARPKKSDTTSTLDSNRNLLSGPNAPLDPLGTVRLTARGG